MNSSQQLRYLGPGYLYNMLQVDVALARISDIFLSLIIDKTSKDCISEMLSMFIQVSIEVSMCLCRKYHGSDRLGRKEIRVERTKIQKHPKNQEIFFYWVSKVRLKQRRSSVCAQMSF
jgi:hypothetical protein